MTFGYLQVFLILLETNPTLKEKDYVLMFTLHIMAQVIEKTQTDAYIDFVAKYPDIKIGQRTFDKLKPFFVRPASEKNRNTCCCRYHIESNLLFKSSMKFRKSKNQSETSEVESYPVYENLGEIIVVGFMSKSKRFIYKMLPRSEVYRVWSWEIEVFYE